MCDTCCIILGLLLCYIQQRFGIISLGGGAAFILPDGTEINSLSGFAYWNPSVGGIQYRKGGVGTYHMEYEYKVNAQGSETFPVLTHHQWVNW